MIENCQRDHREVNSSVCTLNNECRVLLCRVCVSGIEIPVSPEGGFLINFIPFRDNQVGIIGCVQTLSAGLFLRDLIVSN